MEKSEYLASPLVLFPLCLQKDIVPLHAPVSNVIPGVALL